MLEESKFITFQIKYMIDIICNTLYRARKEHLGYTALSRYLIYEFGSEAICLTYHFFSLPAKNIVLYTASMQSVLKDAKYNSCVDF